MECEACHAVKKPEECVEQLTLFGSGEHYCKPCWDAMCIEEMQLI